MKRVLFVVSIALVSSLAALASCTQGKGDRCQVNSDCEGSLVCNKANNTCQTSTGGDLDADVIDAVPTDASTDDAPVDATPDAP